MLAKALAISLHNAPQPDIERLLDDRIMRPLGIPLRAWSISYGESYDQNGIKLYAIGSGGNYTPRALARVGELLLNNGRWRDRQLLSSRAMVTLVAAEGLPRRGSTWGQADPLANLGWWMNTDHFFPSLPQDAIFALGDGFQVVLVIPSLRLVVVRVGGHFDKQQEQPWTSLERYIFKPLMDAITDH